MSKATKFLTAADIFAADDAATIEVDVPEWGGSVRLRKMTAADSIAYGASPAGEALLKLIELCAIDSEGNRLFTGDDVERLKTRAWDVCVRLHAAAAKLNGIGPGAEAAAKNG